MAQELIGVIGGSGLYEVEGLAGVERKTVDTPFGAPSDEYVLGELDGQRVAFLPRHGRGHRLTPSEVNYCANVHGFRQLGARWLISVSAVGSMRENISPGDLVLVDQFIDRTKNRRSSFFGDGVVGHVAFADPVCGALREVLHSAATTEGARVHMGGTYLCIEGPAFSTRAESRLYRQWGVDVIGMTNLPEAKLAREAGLCYASMAMATDYDCWYESEEDVSVEAVIATLNKNVDLARRVIAVAVQRIDAAACRQHEDAGRRAAITAKQAMNPDTRKRLGLILGT